MVADKMDRNAMVSSTGGVCAAPANHNVEVRQIGCDGLFRGRRKRPHPSSTQSPPLRQNARTYSIFERVVIKWTTVCENFIGVQIVSRGMIIADRGPISCGYFCMGANHILKWPPCVPL